MKKQLILTVVASSLLAGCGLHAPNNPSITLQDRKEKSMQCHQLKRMIATGEQNQATAAYREYKGLGCGN